MITLNTSYGWSEGDQVRLLIASGLSVGSYQLTQVVSYMNHLGSLSTDIVNNLLDLIDQYDTAQQRYNELNSAGDSRVLIKADVLEWAEQKVTNYSPQIEISRIRGIIWQYMSGCELYSGEYNGVRLIRS